jgi:hypothetical protein
MNDGDALDRVMSRAAASDRVLLRKLETILENWNRLPETIRYFKQLEAGTGKK